MSKYVYVDNSNVWIEGMRVSAVERGLAFDVYDASSRNIVDYDWKYDFGKLLEIVAGPKNNLKRAVLFGSRPPQNDSLWQAAQQCGFETVIMDRNAQNREKKIDMGVGVTILEDSYSLIQDKKEDEMILIAGDSDYVPVVESVVRRGIQFSVWFWEHASRELKEVATNFVALDPYIDKMRR
ncbi:MAG: NYN domain-containing protein [Planctomycetaceae bacterium]|nr:NYN domain-containing protein [Planctomycetaceae bacterium]